MATKTKITEFRRSLRQKNAGRARKNALNNKGTTPAFPIHTPEIDAQAPAAQVAPKKD
ncbi:MAG: hypothetical protein H6733_15915 [Alphaproteobacteria bacterium]|nr:hypothetical protein [Alphaproteobacteria bacterium]